MMVSLIVVTVRTLLRSPKAWKNSRGIGNKRKIRKHPDCSSVKMGKNTEKSLETCGDLLSLSL